MAEEANPFTTTESRVMMMHRGACTCGWMGDIKTNLEEAKVDRDKHISEKHSN